MMITIEEGQGAEAKEGVEMTAMIEDTREAIGMRKEKESITEVILEKIQRILSQRRRVTKNIRRETRKIRSTSARAQFLLPDPLPSPSKTKRKNEFVYPGAP